MVENNSSSNNSMNASFFVVWVGMSQLWLKHTWEETYNVWVIRENFTQEVTLGQVTEMELKLAQVHRETYWMCRRV